MCRDSLEIGGVTLQPVNGSGNPRRDSGGRVGRFDPRGVPLDRPGTARDASSVGSAARPVCLAVLAVLAELVGGMGGRAGLHAPKVLATGERLSHGQ